MTTDWTRNERIALASLFATIIGTIATIATIPGARQWFLSHRVAVPSVKTASVVPFPAGQPVVIDDEQLKRLCEVRLTHDDVAKLTTSELEILRNSIYALHGRSFERRKLREFLSRQSWYRADTAYSDARLTKTDWYNIDLIRRAEKARGDGGA